MKHPRIAVCAPNETAFSETFITNHVKGLREVVAFLSRGWFPSVCNGQPIPLEDTSASTLWDRLPFKRKVSKKNRSAMLADFLREKEIEVVLAEYGVTAVMVNAACHKARIPMVVQFHGFDATHKETLAKYGTKYLQMFERATAIVANCHSMAKQLADLGAPPQKIHTIHMGVDLNLFKPSKRSTLPQRFVAAGRFVSKKAPHLTLLAFSKVLEEFPGAELIMIGEGPPQHPDLYLACKEMAQALGMADRVRFTGAISQEEVGRIMADAGIFLQHSVTSETGDSEGTALTVVEASASGLAVISTKHAGIPDAIIHGETGYLCEERDVEQMAHYMKLALRNPERTLEMGRKGAERIPQFYDLKAQLQKLEKVLADAIANYSR